MDFNFNINVYFRSEEDDSRIDEILDELDEIKENQEKLMSKITDFADAANKALATANDALANIATDEANQAAEIKRLADLIANGDSNLTPEAQAALDGVLANATALADKTKGLADSVPDLPPAPVA